jgi:uncharacterized phage protein (TIGR01671 family)
MRSIKFRAWDKERKEMCLPLGLSFLFETENGIRAEVPETNKESQELFRDIFPENLELMQFTGLKDKNGNGVYEGDIVKAHEVIPSTNELQRQIQGVDAVQLDFIGQVEWDNEGADYQVTDGKIIRGLGMERQVLEIIGNVYENPDLLQ